MIQNTNIVSITPNTDIKNIDFSRKSEWLSTSIYQYLECLDKKGEAINYQDKNWTILPEYIQCTAQSTYWSDDLGANANDMIWNAACIGTAYGASESKITDIKKIILGIELSLDPASIQIEKDQGDIDVLIFSLIENLQTELHAIYSLIKKVFINIKKINIRLYSDPEIGGYKKIIFEVSIDDTIDRILGMEDKFYSDFEKIGEKNNLEYFLLKCQKYET